MLKKAVSQWTIAFLSGFLLTIAVLVSIILVTGPLQQVSCELAQKEQIENVKVRVQEMAGKAGYITVYFEVEDCVEEISYSDGNLVVDYVDKSPESYPTNVDWDMTGVRGRMGEPGTYYLRVFEGHVEVMG